MTSMLLWPATHEWQSSDRCLAMQTNHDQQPHTYLQTLSRHHSKHTDNMYGDVYSEWCLGFSTNQLVSPILNRRATLNPPLCKSMRTAVLHWDWLQQLFIHITGLILSTQVACCLTTAGQHYATWLWSRTPSLSTKILTFGCNATCRCGITYVCGTGSLYSSLSPLVTFSNAQCC